MMAPVGGIVGLLTGIFAGQSWGLSLTWAPLLGCLLGLYTVYFTGKVESFIRVRTGSTAGRAARIVAVAGDLLLGGVAGQILATAIGAESAALLGGGAATLVGYNFFVSRFFWGDWIGDLVNYMSGQVVSTRDKEYAFPRRLAAHGHIDEAVYAYERLSDDHGGETGPLVMAAQLLVDEGRPEEALEWYRRAFDAPRCDLRRASAFAEKIVELAVGELNEPERARPVLVELLQRYPESERLKWARTVLDALPGTTAALAGGEGERGKNEEE